MEGEPVGLGDLIQAGAAVTKDRRNLLECIWQQLYTHTCPCGRCDCITSNPVAIARRVLVHWSVSSRHLAKWASDRANLFAGFAAKGERSRNPLIRSDADEHRVSEARWRREARRQDHATRLYERLSGGLPPFRSAEGEQP